MKYLQRLLEAFFGLFGSKKQQDAGKKPSSGMAGRKPTERYASAENRDIPEAKQIRRTIKYPPQKKVLHEMPRQETAVVPVLPKEQPGDAEMVGVNYAPEKSVTQAEKSFQEKIVPAGAEATTEPYSVLQSEPQAKEKVGTVPVAVLDTSIDEPQLVCQAPLVMAEEQTVPGSESVVQTDDIPAAEETQKVVSAVEAENKVTPSAAGAHEITGEILPSESRENTTEESQTGSVCKQVQSSLEEKPTETESFHWHASGENAFTLCKNDTREGTETACAEIALQKKMPISFPEIQSSLDWEPLALHAAQLVLAPFCEGQANPPRIIESVRDGSVILTCELPEESDKEERSLITVMFTEKMAYLLTGTASKDITTEQYSKSLFFQSN